MILTSLAEYKIIFYTIVSFITRSTRLFCLLQFYICLSIVLVIELVCGGLVIVCYTEPAARDFLRLTPETLLKRAILQYMDDKSIRKLMDTIQRQVIVF